MPSAAQTIIHPGEAIQEVPPGIFCVIPVYNNGGTIKDIAMRCRAILSEVVVVDDGSTDVDVADLLSEIDITVLRHDQNLGKGRAIMTGLEYVNQQNGTYMITIDADGQHYPEDLHRFLPYLAPEADTIIIGARDFSGNNIPGGSRFGRKFASFWLKVETGKGMEDCQSGFRAYPVSLIKQLALTGRYYDFEAEILARASWAGLELKTVPIRVWYPNPGEKRITSFRPFLDNFRLSCMHARLVGRRLLPFPHRQLIKRPDKKKEEIKNLLHPVKFITRLLQENSSPLELGAAAALGVFVGVAPIFGLHSVVIYYMASRLNMNKLMALSAQNICMPPVVPAFCIELGFYLRHGTFLTDFSVETIFIEFKYRIWEWFLGSLILGPILAILTGILVYGAARLIANYRPANEQRK
jgi:glycosyltransferase involved in cell wall biosynthesis